MVNSVTYEKFKQIGEEIAQVKDVHEFGRRLKYEFMDFIDNNPLLSKEWKRRSEFYENLRNSLEFKSLLDSIHKGFKHIQRTIEPKKLPENLRLMNQEMKTLESVESFSLREIHTMLSKRSEWPKFDDLNETTGVYVSKSSPPWDSCLRQYELFEPFFFKAERLKAVRGGDETVQVALQVLSDIKALRDLITTPLVRWHLHSFYDLRFYGRTPEFIQSVDSVSKSVSRVCSELLFHLKETEEQRKNSGKKPTLVKSVIRGIVSTTTGKEIPFKKKTAKTSILCEKVYSDCRLVGDKVRIEFVFKDVWKDDYKSDSLGNWKTVDSACRNVNKWAKKHGLPDMLQCTTEWVERLA